MLRVLAIVVTVGLGFSHPASAQDVRRVFPPDPYAGEAVAFVGTYDFGTGGYFSLATSRLDGNVFTIEQPATIGVAPNKWSRFGATLGSVAAGTYTLRGGPYVNANAFGGFPVPPFGLTFTVAPGSPSTPRYTSLDGNWFDPAQAGWGVNLVQGASGALFAVLLGYADRYADDFPNWPATWFVMPAGRWVSPTTFRGVLYESAGTRLGTTPQSTHVAPVGMLSLEFVAEDRVRIRFVRANILGKWAEGESNLRRFAF